MFQGFCRWTVVPMLAIGLAGFSALAVAGDLGLPLAEQQSYALVPPDDLMLPPTKAWTYHDIALTQAKAGDVSGALKTVSQIRGEWKKAWTYRRIAVTQAEAGDVSGAMKTVSQIRDKRAKAWTYRDIAVVQANAGDVSGAMKTASQIRD
jgi:hypothetical protein